MSAPSLQEALGEHRRIALEGLPDAALAYVIATRLVTPATRPGPASTAGPLLPRPLLVVTADDDRAEQLALDLAALGVEAVLFPGDEHTPYEEISPDPRRVAARLAVRDAVSRGARPAVIVAPAVALLWRWLPDAPFAEASATWRRNEAPGRETIAERLVLCGYQRASLVEDEGTFAIRGGIIDLYPPGAPGPLRLDLFGDEIASIKSFDPSTQRTGAEQEALRVHPIREIIFTEPSVTRAQARLHEIHDQSTIPTRRIHQLLAEVDTRNYFFGVESLWPLFYESSAAVIDTLLGAEAVLVVDKPELVNKATQAFIERALAELSRQQARQNVALKVSEHLLSDEELTSRLASVARIDSAPLTVERDALALRPAIHDWVDLTRELTLRRTDASRGEILDPLVAELKHRFEEQQDLFIAASTRGNAERLRELLLARKIDLPIQDSMPDLVPPRPAGREREDGKRRRRAPRRAIVQAALSGGFVDDELGVAVLSDVEILGVPLRRRRGTRPAPSGEGLSTLKDLAVGDFVVHVDHGVGRYLGLKRIVLDGADGDYVHLEYQGGDKLYLPVYRLNLLQRYRGPTAGAKLDKLGGTRWERAKQRVKDAVLAMAHELLALQARRHALPGYALPKPDEHYRAFEASFPYDETPDQLRAIEEVKADLAKDSPMDRLVCGDVGFGKTEVAIRAAYLAIMGKKQVAVLVPTTVLAEQHGMTFSERLGAQGVTVEVLSRFRSPREVASILTRVKQGAVDVLIGTHRMLSPDVAFKNLGLLVIDEEHRFGVKHKERIKQLRSHVHVLTLSATPIPRTMHMAMVGLRDLSIIQTPPVDRMAIRTEVTRFDEELITEALRRELHRGGQVFVVHNRIQSIGSMAELVRRLVPEARVGVGHGQMSGEELERVMVQFVRRELDVLVSTAIIESGIDIPSANTMIVNRADTFGLAQLYQLRGRIGRGRERAYAYLLLPRGELLTAEAAERLSVLKRFSELGSGFNIATHDLDLRGAGDLLGGDQSGHIAAVGFELYTELLAEAVERIKGEKHEAAAIEPEIKLPVSAVLPESYMPEPVQRLSYYQRLSQAPNDESIFNILGEIRDFYGETPEEVDSLAEVMVIRRRLMALGALALSADIVQGEVRIGVSFGADAPVDREDLARRLQAEPDRYRLLPSGKLAIRVAVGPKEMPPRFFLRLVREQLGELALVRRGGQRLATA